MTDELEVQTVNLVSLNETWKRQLELAERTDKDWIERGKKVVKRYRDESESVLRHSRFNVLWSNVQTIFPAIYARTPKAEVARRNKDGDPIARTASIILERCLQFELEQYDDFDHAMRLCVQDRLLPGRGTAWVRFEEQEVATVDDPDIEPEVIRQERSTVDYVYWEDFRHSPARTWDEVTWVAKRIYLSKEEVADQFGEEFGDVPLCHVPKGLDKEQETEEIQKAKIWEIWDKGAKRVIWVAEGYDKALRAIDDPLGLEGFFPCPKPLWATQTTDTLVPIPDYCLYQDQAAELDLITQKINLLVDALKVAGLYNQAVPEIQRLLTSSDNTMIGVENWAGFAQTGGMDGSVSWMPIDQITEALEKLYESRDETKQVIYEITGLADIMRGSTKASETYGAQRLKSQYGSLRMAPRQREVAQFATEILRIKAQMMMDLYSPQTLADMSGIENTDDAEGLNKALALMKTEPIRSYRIEVAADSLVEADQDQEREQRVEFLGAAGTFLRQAVEVVGVAPELKPLIGEMLLFGVRGFKAGRDIEAAFESAVKQTGQAQPADPMQSEQAQMQQQMQVEQMKIQADQQVQMAKIQADVQAKQAQAELQARLEAERAQRQMEVDQNRAQAQLQQQALVERQKLEFERWKAELDAATRIQIANISSKAKIDNPATQVATEEIVREVQP